MPTVHNYAELAYVIRTGINKLPQMKTFNKNSIVVFTGNMLHIDLTKKVKEEYVKDVIDEIMENEFSASLKEKNDELGYELNIQHIDGADGLMTIVILLLPDYIHEYLLQDDGEWN